MMDVIKNTLLMGVGLAAMTKDKVEKLARQVADEAKLSSEKGQEFVNEVLDRADKARRDLDTRVRELVIENLRKTPLATREDFAALNERLDRLEKLLAAKGG